jgi:rod shape-determining protein MreC
MTNKTNKSDNFVFVLLILFSLMLILFRLTPTVNMLRGLIYQILVPSIQFTSDSFSNTGKIFSNLVQTVSANQQNIKLKEEVVLLSQQLKDYQDLVEENIKLKNLLNLSHPKETEVVYANIIIREPVHWYQGVIVNKGSNDGLTENLPVLFVDNNGIACVFGRISKVYTTTAEIALITNSLSSIVVKINNEQTDCLLEGADMQYLKLSYIPDNANLQVGDEVVTSKISSVFSNDIPIGKIVDITKTPYNEYSEVLVQPYFQTQSISEVAVLLPKKRIN